MKVAEYSLPNFSAQLKRDGIYLRTGPFVTHLVSPIPALAQALWTLYADCCLVDGASVAHFHLRITPPRYLRRWWRPQVLFFADGVQPFMPMAQQLAFPILEWGWNWCIVTSAHQFLVVHAAVVEREGHALILPAPPGSGKSTLCAALVHSGWRLLSDELALIRLTDGQLQPLARPVSLKESSIQVIQDFAPAARLGPVYRDTHKGTVAHMRPPTDSVARVAETAGAAWVVFPRYEAGAPASFTPLSKARTLFHLADHAFNYSLLGRKAFVTLADMLENCDCFTFRYGNLHEAVELFTTLDRPQTSCVVC